jgi:uncharacterized protein YaaR (DUF327 family)
MVLDRKNKNRAKKKKNRELKELLGDEQQQIAAQRCDQEQAVKDKLGSDLQALLQSAEKQDKNQYKKMIRAHVKQEMPGRHGQKNW